MLFLQSFHHIILNLMPKWKGTVPVTWVNSGTSPSVHEGAIGQWKGWGSAIQRSGFSIWIACWNCLPKIGSVGRPKALSWCC